MWDYWVQDEYACEVKNITSYSSNSLEAVTGTHEPGMSNNDVQQIHINNLNMTIIPSGVTKIFPNTQSLDFHGTGFQSLTARDLAQFGSKLQNLRIEGDPDNRNPISVLPSDVFSFTPNLKRIEFNYNHLQYIGPNIFKGLTSLEYCEFVLNDCINYLVGRSQAECQTFNDQLSQSCNNITALQPSIDQLRNASQASVQSQLLLLITMIIASIARVIGGLSYWRINSRDPTNVWINWNDDFEELQTPSVLYCANREQVLLLNRLLIPEIFSILVLCFKNPEPWSKPVIANAQLLNKNVRTK